MSTLFVRPGHLHTASRVLSASTEAGLCTAPPIPDSDNAGALRLRATGTPTAAVDATVKLQTGGNPSGYALATGSGQGLGSAAIWKNVADADDEWRGYIDTPYLVRVDYPVAYGTGLGRPSTPRTLANGDLGFVLDHAPSPGSELTFTRITPANVATTTTIDSSTFGDYQSDFVVLPDGRLVVIGIFGSALTRFESDDNGATWGTGVQCGAAVSGQDTVSLEYVDDLLTMVISDRTAGVAVTDVRVSRDGGYNWSSVDTAQTLRGVRTCVTPTGKMLAISAASTPLVREMASGGGLSSSTADSALTGAATGHVALAARDDGVIWAFAARSTAGTHVDMDASVSLDGGVTWANPLAGLKVLNCNSLLTGGGFRAISAGTWQGKIVILAHTSSAGTASDNVIAMYTLGGWETISESRTGVGTIHTYDNCMLPVDLPTNFATPWTQVDGAGAATVTNEGPLRFVSLPLTSTYYAAPTAVLAASGAGERYRLRTRVRVNSGGALTDNRSCLRFSISDGGGNSQGFVVRLASTGFALYAAAGSAGDVGTLLESVTLDMTSITDLLFTFQHDVVADTSGLVRAWYKQEADAIWTQVGAGAMIVLDYAVVADSRLWVGGEEDGTADWECFWIGISGQTNVSPTNPDGLAGRPLGTIADYFLTNGIHLGARNAMGVPGDLYGVGTTYQYGKENIWRELRPSKKCHSATSNLAWNAVFYAGAADAFKGDTAGLFGTNFRTATLQLNTADSWGAPAQSVALDATLVTSTVGASNRGRGYVGPATSLNWRPGQFKSDGDAHRYFVDVGGTVYEVTDNDEDRLFVEGVDFSGAAGTFYVFGDKMASTFTFAQYPYMRLLVGAQGAPSGDACYHVGTLIVDKAFTPAQLYDHGFVDRVEPRVELFEADAGYRSRARIGPRRHTLAIQWPPIAVQGPAADLESRIRDFYASLEGRPFLFWRDTTDVSTVGLYTFNGTYQASNVWGERSTALTRVDQLILEEEH